MMQDNRVSLIFLPDHPPNIFGSLRLLYWLRRMDLPLRKHGNKLYRVAGTPRILPCQLHGFGAWPQQPHHPCVKTPEEYYLAAAK
ncbi:MAG TPA: hypothetical protein VMV70_04830 [Gallionella sp.]|nr:hypothetical protein [Gallionella sp.]